METKTNETAPQEAPVQAPETAPEAAPVDPADASEGEVKTDVPAEATPAQ